MTSLSRAPAIIAALFCVGGVLLAPRAAAQFTTVINVPPDPSPTSVNVGEQLNLFAGGTISIGAETLTAHGGELNFIGGTVEAPVLMLGDSRLLMIGGTLELPLVAREESTLSVTGGELARAHVYGASRLEVTGGTFTGSLNVGINILSPRGIEEGDGPPASGTEPTATLTVHGGSFQGIFASQGGTADLHAGQFNARVEVRGGTANLYGGEYPAGLHVLHSGETITRSRGIANVYGGVIGADTRVRGGSTLNFHDGEIGPGLLVDQGTFNMFGGQLGEFAEIFASTAHFYGGSIARVLRIGSLHSAYPNTVAHIHGGEFGDQMVVSAGGIVHIHGGTFNGRIAYGFGETYIYGTSFKLLDSAGSSRPLSLAEGVPYALTHQRMRLEAVLADGTPFERNFDSTYAHGTDYWAPDGRIHLVLVRVPEPATITLVLLALGCLPLRRRLLNR